MMHSLRFANQAWRAPIAGWLWLSILAMAWSPVDHLEAATIVDAIRPRTVSAPMLAMDYDRDGKADVVMARQGEIWWRQDVAQPESTWAPLPFEIPTGFEVDTMEAGDLDGDGAADLILTSSSAQRALLFRGVTRSDTEAVGQVIEVPGGVQAVEWLTPSKVLLLAKATPRPYVTLIPGNASTISGAPVRPTPASDRPVSASRFGISVDGYQVGGVLDMVAGPLGIAASPMLGLLWQASNALPSQVLFGELSSGVVRSATALRRKWPDIVLKRGCTRLELGWATVTQEVPLLVAWSPGGSDLNVVVLHSDGTARVTEVGAETLGFAVGEVRRVAGIAGDEWLIRDADGTRVVVGRAGFDGRFLVARDLVAPAGERFESVLGLADGGVIATSGRAGGTGKTLAAEWLGVYQNRDGQLELVSRTALPSSARPVLRASVVVYERDPFLDPTARELEVLAAGVWTREAMLVTGGVSVTTETFKSGRSGLGFVEVREIRTGQTLPAMAYVMANQWKSDTSVFFGVSSRGPGTRDPEVVGGAAADSDRDGMNDAWERWCFGGLELGPDEDRDGDGFGALAEYQNATDPTDARSRPSVDDQDLSLLSDEFDDPGSMPRWRQVWREEGWGADQLQAWDINGNHPGRMTMIPHTSTWFRDWRGVLAFQEVDGDFVMTTDVEVSSRSGTGAPLSTYSLAGIMIRRPRPTVTSPATWNPGGENYVFLSLGCGDTPGTFQVEAKTTRNSDSVLTLSPASSRARIQVARVGSAFLMLRQEGEGSWQVHRRYSRTDLPPRLQAGLTTYTDWPGASALDPWVHNQTVMAGGHPDLLARFEYARYARPRVPAELAGRDLTDPGQVSDAALLAFLGANANVPGGASRPSVLSVVPGAVASQATLSAAELTPDRSYRLLRTLDLVNWEVMEEWVNSATTRSWSVTAGESAAVYRVVSP